jgi:hypothetical protein
LSFMRIWAFQGLWDLSEIQASCLFTLVMFVSWFFGTTYFIYSSSSWFHDPQASCLFTLVMFIFDFVALHYFHVFFLVGFRILLIFFSLLLVGMLGNLTPPNLVVIIFFLIFLQLLKNFDLPPLVFYTNLWFPSLMFTTLG